MPCPFHDPFKAPRQKDGVLVNQIGGESIPMVLRHADVRQAARDWQTFSSDAPMRVPIPSEEDLRSVRQLPIETDPPAHGAYKGLVEPFFKRAKQPEVIAKVTALIDGMLAAALARDSIEIVRDFALPLQSRALTHLLNVDESEAETWISWGTHVFHDDHSGEAKGEVLDTYLHQQFDRAAQSPGEDFFSVLSHITFEGRKLTRDELVGFANLTFAGGRDTIINSIAGIIEYLALKPDTLDYLREDPKRIVSASEEFFRVLSPLTHIGRVCPVQTEVQGVTVGANKRMSLGWASANFDETVFEAPEEVKLDRKPNPHVAFGFGTHLCLGAPHARLLIRTLLQSLCDQVSQIQVLDSKAAREERGQYQRHVGWEMLRVKLTAKSGRPRD